MYSIVILLALGKRDNSDGPEEESVARDTPQV